MLECVKVQLSNLKKGCEWQCWLASIFTRVDTTDAL